MRTIITKQDNVINCDCGTVIEFDEKDLKLKNDKGNLFAITVECPTCNKAHIVTPKEFDSTALLGSLKAKKGLNAMTYEELSKAAHGADRREIFHIGGVLTATLKNGYVADLCVLGIDHEGVEGVTFGLIDLYGTDDDGGHVMNTEYTNSTGWTDSDIRKYLNGEFFNLLPDALQAIIKPVTKKTASSGSGKAKIVETIDKIFLPSEVEVFGKCRYSKSGEGEQYEGFKNWRNRVKGYSDGQYGRFWWLRSPYSGDSGSFCIVNSYGGYGNNGAYSTNGVSPCFAI